MAGEERASLGAEQHDVEGLAPIGTSALRALEPGVRATAALHSPETGIVDAHGLCLSLLAEAEAQGAVLALDRRVEALATTSFGWRLDVRGGDGGSEGLDFRFRRRVEEG